MGSSLIVRPARVQDVRQMARVHVRCWQETYRGLMPDAVLDDPDFPAARERMWTDVLTSERYRPNRVAVAERDGELAGIAMSGPPDDATAAWARQLYVLYVYAADHGTGTGEALLEAVVDSAEPAALWVADTNPRAQAFYRKHGFAADGTARFEDGVRRSAWSAACSTTGPAAPATGKPSVAAPAEETRLPGPLVWPLREWGQIKPASRLSDSGGADSSPITAGPTGGALTRAPAAEIPVPVMPLEGVGLPSSPGQ